MTRSADVLTSLHSRTSSVPHVLSSLATSHVLVHPWTTAERSRIVWLITKGLEPQIKPTSSNLAPHSWIWCRSTQHWSGNCLSSSTKSAGMEGARGNGNVHWTSHTMMMMMMMLSFETALAFMSTRRRRWELNYRTLLLRSLSEVVNSYFKGLRNWAFANDFFTCLQKKNIKTRFLKSEKT